MSIEIEGQSLTVTYDKKRKKNPECECDEASITSPFFFGWIHVALGEKKLSMVMMMDE